MRWLLLWRMGSRRLASVVAAHGLLSTASVVVVHGLSCSVVYGVFQDQGSNPCLLRWQTDSLPLSLQGSRRFSLFWLLFGTSGKWAVSRPASIRKQVGVCETMKVLSLPGVSVGWTPHLSKSEWTQSGLLAQLRVGRGI